MRNTKLWQKNFAGSYYKFWDTAGKYDETTKDILNQLGERRINLVSISAKEPIVVIPDILYMLGMKSALEMQRDNQFLMEYNLMDKMPVYELL